MLNFKYSLMDNRNDNRKDSNKAILMLFVLYFAIILREATTGPPNFTWVAIMGAIVIALSLSAMFLPDQRGGDILYDR